MSNGELSQYDDRSFLYLDSDARDWMPNVTLSDSAILGNDNSSQSHETSLFEIYSNNFNERAQIPIPCIPSQAHSRN